MSHLQSLSPRHHGNRQRFSSSAANLAKCSLFCFFVALGLSFVMLLAMVDSALTQMAFISNLKVYESVVTYGL
jgi:hypothetical protein